MKMADPISVIGLVAEIGSLIKALYDYGGSVKKAQGDIINICAELTALKSTLELYSQYGNTEAKTGGSDFDNMLRLTEGLIGELAKSTTPKPTATGRAMQSLSWPFSTATVKDKLSRLERLKTWFLMAFTLENKVNVDEMQGTMRDILALVQQQGNETLQRQEVEADRALLALIAPMSPESAHRKACRTWQGTVTGSWFIEGELKAWLDQPDAGNRTMVLTGRSGTGKTVLISRAVEEAKSYSEAQKGVCVAYFYCAYNDVSSRQTRNILGSWVAQVSAQRRGVLQLFPARAQRVEDISIAQLEDSLIHVSQDGRLLLLLDAINESTDGSDLIASLNRLLLGSTNIQVVVSTTPHYRPLNENLTGLISRASMLPECVEQDIAIYIRDQISKHRVLSRIPAEEIIQALLPKSESMFRWVDCQMKFLTSQLTPNAVKAALRTLPATLDSTYEVMLGRVSSPRKPLVKGVLTWLSFCQRPLRLDELCEALVIQEDQRVIDDGDRIEEPEELLAMCEGLAEINAATGEVSLAHSSVKDFLTGSYIQSSKVADFALDEVACSRELVRKCVAYLLMEPFKGGYNPEWDEDWRRAYITEMLSEYHLLHYVCGLWAVHANSCELTDRESTLIQGFFETQRQPGGGNFAFWLCCLLPDHPIGAVHESQPLYYAASFGITSIVRLMLESGLVHRSPIESGWQIDHKGGRNGSTALQVACFRGHADVVDLLLKAGASPYETDSGDMSSISWADIHGFRDIVAMLEKAGAKNPKWRFEKTEDGQGFMFATDGSGRVKSCGFGPDGELAWIAGEP